MTRIDTAWERYHDQSHIDYKCQRDRVEWILSQVVGPRVLEIGCGGGLVTYKTAILPQVEHVTAIDIDPIALELAEKRCKVLDNVSFSRLSAEMIPSARYKAFDTILLNEVLEHVEVMEATLSPINDILCKRGRLVATVPRGGKISQAHRRVFKNCRELGSVLTTHFDSAISCYIGRWICSVARKDEEA